MSFDVELSKLFETCDRSKRGFIGKNEFRELCSSFEISSADADAIFIDLDRDGDAKISFEDFAQGFREFLRPPQSNATPGNPAEKGAKFKLKRQATQMAWRQFAEQLGKENVRKFLRNSGDHLYSLYEEMQQTEAPPQLVIHYEKLIESIVADINGLEEQQKNLEVSLQKEREQHQQHLRSLEEELETQVERVASAARKEAEQKFEQEKRNLQMRMEMEVSQLQAHLKMLQRVEELMKQGKHSETLRSQDEALRQLDEASLENRNLKLSLTDAQTALALLQTELVEIKSQYEERYRRLKNEKDSMMDYLSHQDHLQNQLQLLQDANRHLQDTNDSLRNMDFLTIRRSPISSELCLGRSPSAQEFNRLSQNSEFIHPLADSGHCSMIFGDHPLYPRAIPLEGPTSFQDEINFGKMSISPQPGPDIYTMPLFKLNENSGTSLEPTGPPDRTFKVVFAGDAAVGKSSFITRLHQGVFISNTTTTLGVDFKVKTLRIDERNIAIQLWDTAGQERFRSITQSYFRRADGVVILFDLTNEISFINVRHWMESIRESTDKPLAVVLCGAKYDLRSPADENQGMRCCISKSQAEKFANELGVPYFETSAKTGYNVLDAIVCLARKMTTLEDVEVRTSGLRLTENRKKNTCCGGQKKQ